MASLAIGCAAFKGFWVLVVGWGLVLGSLFLAALGGMAIEVSGFGRFVRGGRLGSWVLGFGSLAWGHGLLSSWRWWLQPSTNGASGRSLAKQDLFNNT